MTSPSADTGQAPAAAGLSDYNALQFVIRQMLGRVGTTMLVQVKAVQPGAVGPVGFCDIQPLVSMTDGAGVAMPHGIIFNVPYFRLQGGANAVIIDPVAGDIGIAVVASRDISSVKQTKAAATPGSRRRFDLADSLYIGGVLNGVPTQYIQFHAGGVKVHTAATFRVEAAAIDLQSSSLTHNGVNVGSTHVHGGVQSGVSNTSGPS